MREKIPRLKLWVRGVYHKFERYHPRFQSFSDEDDDAGWRSNFKYCGYCAPKKVLFAHEDCWKLVERHGFGSRNLYQFAVQTQPLLLWRSDKSHCRPEGVFHCGDDLNPATSLGGLVAEISRRLPPELRQCIVRDSEECGEYDEKPTLWPSSAPMGCHPSVGRHTIHAVRNSSGTYNTDSEAAQYR